LVGSSVLTIEGVVVLIDSIWVDLMASIIIVVDQLDEFVLIVLELSIQGNMSISLSSVSGNFLINFSKSALKITD